MEDLPADEEVEDADELIVLRYASSWPVFTLSWTRRRRHADGESFPVRSGVIRSTARPPDWAAMREEALAEAGAKPGTSEGGDRTDGDRSSIFRRILHRD